MGVIEYIFERFKGTKSGYEFLFDLDIVESEIQNAYLKKMAIDSVLNFVARTFSTTNFTFKNGKDIQKTDWDYILNVRPNKNDSASDFWQKAIYKLMFDNELLIIKTDDDQLLIADDFYKEEYAVYEDRYKGVVVKDYEFKSSFSNSEVIYLSYGNEELQVILDDLFKDYGELFGRMLQIAMRNNQIRGSLKTGSTSTWNEDTAKKMQGFVDRMYKSFNNESVAVVPLTKDFDYEEYTNKTGIQNQSADELTKLKKSVIDDVARIVGVPSALVHGEMADSENNSKAFRTQCVAPLIKKIESELNAKLITRAAYTNGLRIQINGVYTPNIFDLATASEKLVGSMILSPNEAREAHGYARVDEPAMDRYYMTKNFASDDEIKIDETDEVKGGDVD